MTPTGPGRPRKPAALTAAASTRLMPHELAWLRSAADRDGLTVSQLLRALVLEAMAIEGRKGQGEQRGP